VKKVKTDKISVAQYADRIAECGIVVIDGITTMPIMYQPFISQNYVFGICHSGEIEAEYDTQDVHYCQHEVSIVYPSHPLWIKRVSENYLSTLVVVSAAEYKELSSHVSFRNRFLYEQSPAFLLTDSQYADLMNIIGTMRILDNSEIASRLQLMENLLNVLLDMTDYFRHQNESQDELAPQRLSAKFHQAIADNHGKSHSVGYYADLFFLSPKYFSDVIKKETGHSAKHWIGAYLIREAKLLLRTRRDLNIQQISDMLGYDDQTSFSRHFKKETGMSPTKYKKSE
jgi:AraC-like DNA-binding protein